MSNESDQTGEGRARGVTHHTKAVDGSGGSMIQGAGATYSAPNRRHGYRLSLGVSHSIAPAPLQDIVNWCAVLESETGKPWRVVAVLPEPSFGWDAFPEGNQLGVGCIVTDTEIGWYAGYYIGDDVFPAHANPNNIALTAADGIPRELMYDSMLEAAKAAQAFLFMWLTKASNAVQYK